MWVTEREDLICNFGGEGTDPIVSCAYCGDKLALESQLSTGRRWVGCRRIGGTRAPSSFKLLRGHTTQRLRGGAPGICRRDVGD